MSSGRRLIVWRELFRFELRYHLSQPLFLIAAIVLFALGMLAMSSDAGVRLTGAPGNVARNAPIVIVQLQAALTTLALFVVTAFVSSSALRDFRYGAHPLFFTTSVRELDYLTGRFAGSALVSLLLFLATPLGLVVGEFVPWQNPDRIGSFELAPYFFGLLVLVVPTLFFMSAMFFALAITTRSLLATYIGVVVFLEIQDFAEILVRDLDSSLLASLLEPLGLVALRSGSRYWTVAEYNSALPGLSAELVGNRLLWLGVGLVALGWAAYSFSYARATARRWWRRKSSLAGPAEPTLEALPPTRAADAAQPSVSRNPWRQWLAQSRMEISYVTRSAPFLILLLASLSFIVSVAAGRGEVRGSPAYPVTYLMLESIGATMALALVVVVTLYAGELVWRERATRFDGIRDALPVADGVWLAAKLSALLVVVAAFVGAGMLATVGLQLARGFTVLELGLYARSLALISLPFALLAVMALFLQVVTGDKFIGYLLMIVVLVVRAALPLSGWDTSLYRFAALPALPYSDLNGYGHFVGPYLALGLYWCSFAALLTVVAWLVWPRGNELSWRTRLAQARSRLIRSAVRRWLALAALAFVATGAWAYYQTRVAGEYLSLANRVEKFGEYERRYRSFEDRVLPRVSEVSADVDIFPDERRVVVDGRYRLINDSTAPIRELPFTLSPRLLHDLLRVDGGVVLEHLELSRANRLVVDDHEHGFFVYQLDEPLLPGEEMDASFGVTLENPGFSSPRANNLVVANGTFFTNRSLFPVPGYVRSNEVQHPRLRRRAGLPQRERMASIDDVAARSRNYLQADWVRFDSTVSTSRDQIAIGPGVLQREWLDGDRRYFHYRTEAPTLNFVFFASADYVVARDRWQDVLIEVYHHPEHPYNIEHMIEMAKVSLDVYTAQFGPFQHSELRIVEIPRYVGQTAFSLANTIAVSESYGFVSDIGPDDLDVVVDVMAHEIAHQWWNHQVIGADVQGATLISEALAEYSTLLVVERTADPEQLRRFLASQLDRYLAGRGNETTEELPLLLVENQAYVHYYKGSLVWYALRDLVGEEVLHAALRRFLAAEAYQGAPYPTSRELVQTVREAAPAGLDSVIDEMFTTITLFDIRLTSATLGREQDGRYPVTMELSARKLRADGLGAETEIPIDDWVDMAVYGEQDEQNGGTRATVLYQEKHRLSESLTTIELLVDARPVSAAVDPYHRLIDRDSADNVRSLAQDTSAP